MNPPRITRFIQHASYAAIVNKAKLDIKSDQADLKIPVKNMFCLCNILRIRVYKKERQRRVQVILTSNNVLKKKMKRKHFSEST